MTTIRQARRVPAKSERPCPVCRQRPKPVDPNAEDPFDHMPHREYLRLQELLGRIMAPCRACGMWVLNEGAARTLSPDEQAFVVKGLGAERAARQGAADEAHIRTPEPVPEETGS